jgi:hypothetical protein
MSIPPYNDFTTNLIYYTALYNDFAIIKKYLLKLFLKYQVLSASLSASQLFKTVFFSPKNII